jgi:pantoate--beta-alanine ligase
MLNMVGADRAYFGAKDAQQVALVRRLVADLNIPAEIRTLPIVREADGLALSSRNIRLSAGEREQATALSRALQAAAAADPASREDSALTILRDAGVEPEYVAVVDPETFQPASNGRALIAVAARIGNTRLIDNLELPTP